MSARVRGSSAALNKTTIINMEEMRAKTGRTVTETDERLKEIAHKMHLRYKVIQEQVNQLYEVFFTRQREVALEKFHAYKVTLAASERENTDMKNRIQELETRIQ